MNLNRMIHIKANKKKKKKLKEVGHIFLSL